MPARGQWVFDPDSGGKKIPPSVQMDIQKRIQKVAEEQFQGQLYLPGYSLPRPVLLH